MSKSTLWYIISVIFCASILVACWWTVWKEIGKQFPRQEWKQIESNGDVKIYQGKWKKEGYLEVTK